MGGAGGNLSIQIAVNNPSIQSTTFDLPAVQKIAERNIESVGVNDRVKAISGDFFTDEFPKADVITMGNILHELGFGKEKSPHQKSI